MFPPCARRGTLPTHLYLPLGGLKHEADQRDILPDYQPLQLALAKVGVDKGVFEILAEAKRGGKILTNASLADKAGIDPVLLKRILRYWQSLGTISQPDEDGYTANNVTDALASVQGRTAIIHK